MENLDALFWPIIIYALYFLARGVSTSKKNRNTNRPSQTGSRPIKTFDPQYKEGKKIRAEKSTMDMLKNLSTQMEKEVQVLDPRKKKIQVLDPVKNETQVLEYGNKDIQVLDRQSKKSDQSSTKKHVLELMEREKSISIEKEQDKDFEEEENIREEEERKDFFFDDDVVLQGIIFSEVLGKPKSLRK